MRIKEILIVLVCFFCFIPLSFSASYKWEDEKGGSHFTDDPNTVPPESRDKVKKMKEGGNISVVPSSKYSAPASRSKEESSADKKGKKKGGGKKVGKYKAVEDMSTEEIKKEMFELEESIKSKKSKMSVIDQKRDMRLYNPNRFYSAEQFEEYKKTKKEVVEEETRYEALARELGGLPERE